MNPIKSSNFYVFTLKLSYSMLKCTRYYFLNPPIHFLFSLISLHETSAHSVSSKKNQLNYYSSITLLQVESTLQIWLLGNDFYLKIHYINRKLHNNLRKTINPYYSILHGELVSWQLFYGSEVQFNSHALLLYASRSWNYSCMGWVPAFTQFVTSKCMHSLLP